MYFKHFIHCISGQTLKPDLSPELNHLLRTQFRNQSKTRDNKKQLAKIQPKIQQASASDNAETEYERIHGSFHIERTKRRKV